MFVKDIEISIFGEMTYSANIAFSQDAMSAPTELKKIIQEVCNKFLQKKQTDLWSIYLKYHIEALIYVYANFLNLLQFTPILRQ